MAETLQEFVVNLKYAVDTASQDNFLNVLKRVATSVGGVAAEIGGLAAAILVLGKQMAETGAQFHFMAERLGSSIGDIQAATYAMQQLGASSEEAAGGIERFGAWTRNMGPAATNYLRALGVTATDTVGRMKQLGEYFRTHGGNLAQQGSQEYALALRSASMMGIDEGTMNRLASGAFAKQTKDAGIVQQMVWGAGTQEQLAARQAHWAHAADEVIQRFNKMFLIFDTMKQRFGSGLFDKLIPVLDQINAFLLRNQETFAKWGNAASTIMTDFLTLFGTLIETFEKLPGVIKYVIAGLGGWKMIAPLLASPIFWVIMAIGALLIVLNDFYRFQEGKSHEIPWEKLAGYLEAFKKKLNEIIEPIMNFGKAIADWWDNLKKSEGFMGAVVRYIDNAAKALGGLLWQVTKAWGMGLLNPLGWIADVFKNAYEAMSRLWEKGEKFFAWLRAQKATEDERKDVPPRVRQWDPAYRPKAERSTGNMFAGPGVPGVGWQGENIAPEGGGFAARYFQDRFGLGDDLGGAPRMGGMGGPTMEGEAPSLAGVGAGGLDNFRAPAGGNNQSILAAYFQAQGWSPAQTAGILANLKAESSTFSPSEVGDRGLAYGIAQWHPDRQAMFERVMRRPIRGSSLLEQAQFVQWELTHTEAKAGQMLRGQSTARGAGAAVSRYYERPGDTFGEMARRGASAESMVGGMPIGASAGGFDGGGDMGGGMGGKGITIQNSTTINVAAGHDAMATARAVAGEQTRINEAHIRSAKSKLT